MANTEYVEIVKHLTLEELESKIKGGIDDDFPDMTPVERQRVITRLQMVRLRYKGRSVAEVADILGVNRQSCYNWQDAWNSNGVKGLIPRFDGGAPSKLSREQKADVAEYVNGRELCTDAVVDYVENAYSIRYTPMQMSRILKEQGLVYRRGYKIDRRRPDDPVGDLKKTSDWHWVMPETT